MALSFLSAQLKALNCQTDFVSSVAQFLLQLLTKRGMLEFVTLVALQFAL